MNRRITGIFVTLVLLAGAVSMSWSAELIDEIVAVVGDYPILKSEVDFQAQMMLMQQPNRKMTEAEVDDLRKQLLEQMVNDKLILTKALRDTSISISSEQIEEALDYKLDELRSRFPSQADFDRQMQVEGLTYRELKNKFREEMRNQLYKDRLISRELQKVSISPSEIDEFFAKFKDSLPPHPDAVKLAHILLPVEASQETLDSARAKMVRVKELFDQGMSFEQLAREHSEDVTAESGGDLGYFGRGDLVPEFERVAFALAPGEVSDVVETQFGYHIIKCEDISGSRVRCRHILALAKPTDEDKADVLRLADSLKLKAEEGADFAELVKEFSADDESKKQGGDLGWFVSAEMTPEFARAVSGLETGDTSTPTESQYGVHVLKVLDKQTSRPWSIEEDLDRLKDLAKREKTESVVNKLLSELRKETYVDIRQ